MNEIDDLQSRIAFQEDTLASLNQRVSEQQRQLDSLQAQLQHLYKKYKEVALNLDQPGGDDMQQPPPHY